MKPRISRNQLQKRIDAATGRIHSDLIFKDVSYLDVFSCSWKMGDVALSDGVIVGVDSGLTAHRTVVAQGKYLVPGFIDAHVHIESSLMTPDRFETAVLSKGTTTAVCDPHELANVVGVEGIKYFLGASQDLSLDLRVMLSSCVPATHFETNGGGEIPASQLAPLAAHPHALGLAEMMNVPGVINGDLSVLDKLEAFSSMNIDGHCPLLRGNDLSAYASGGISSCHESTQFSEAAEKLSKGISIWIREGSVAKDLHALAPLLTVATSTSIGFCTDDRNPLDISNQGHVDFLVREAIAQGVPVEVAYRSASWSVARHYGLKFKGAIAPGYEGDLVLLDDAQTCSIAEVYKSGKWVKELPAPRVSSTRFSNTVRAHVPEEQDLVGPSGRVHVIGVLEGKIITERHVMNHDAPGVARLSVLERYGKGSKPCNAYALGFGENFRGAIASSVGHDSHNLIVVGTNTADMRAALAQLIASGGGFCVAQSGSILATLALPMGGLMSEQEPQKITAALQSLRRASESIGCALSEPFLQLAFLSLPVIPTLKLTDQGLVDVNQFKIIDVIAR